MKIPGRVSRLHIYVTIVYCIESARASTYNSILACRTYRLRYVIYGSCWSAINRGNTFSLIACSFLPFRPLILQGSSSNIPSKSVISLILNALVKPAKREPETHRAGSRTGISRCSRGSTMTERFPFCPSCLRWSLS